LLEWLALDAGYDTGNQPARQAQLDYGNQRRIHGETDQGSAKVIRLALPWHLGLRRSIYICADGCNLLAARPIESAQLRSCIDKASDRESEGPLQPFAPREFGISSLPL